MYVVLVYHDELVLTDVYGPFKTIKAARQWAKKNVCGDEEGRASYGAYGGMCDVVPIRGYTIQGRKR